MKFAPQLGRALTKPKHQAMTLPTNGNPNDINAFAFNKIKSEQPTIDERRLSFDGKGVMTSPMNVSPQNDGVSRLKNVPPRAASSYFNSVCNARNPGNYENGPIVASNASLNDQKIVVSNNTLKHNNPGLMSPNDDEDKSRKIENLREVLGSIVENPSSLPDKGLHLPPSYVNSRERSGNPYIQCGGGSARECAPIQPGSMLRSSSEHVNVQQHRVMVQQCPERAHPYMNSSNVSCAPSANQTPFSSPNCTPIANRSRHNSGQHIGLNYPISQQQYNNHPAAARQLSLNEDVEQSMSFTTPGTPMYDRSRHNSQQHTQMQQLNRGTNPSAASRSRHSSGARGYQPYNIKDHVNTSNIHNSQGPSRVQQRRMRNASGGGIILAQNNSASSSNGQILGLTAAGPYSAPHSPHVEATDTAYQQHPNGPMPALIAMPPQDYRRRHTSAGSHSTLIRQNILNQRPSTSHFQTPSGQPPMANRTLMSLLSENTVPNQPPNSMNQDMGTVSQDQQQNNAVCSTADRPQSVPLPDMGTNNSCSLSVPSTPHIHNSQQNLQPDMQNFTIQPDGGIKRFNFDPANLTSSADVLDRNLPSSNSTYSNTCQTTNFNSDTICEELMSIANDNDIIDAMENNQCMQALDASFKDNFQIINSNESPNMECHQNMGAPLSVPYNSNESETSLEVENPFDCRNGWVPNTSGNASNTTQEPQISSSNSNSNSSSGNVMFSSPPFLLQTNITLNALNNGGPSSDSFSHHMSDLSPSSQPPSMTNGSDIHDDYTLNHIFENNLPSLELDEQA